MIDSMMICRDCLQTTCQCVEGRNKNEKDLSPAAVLVRRAPTSQTIKRMLVIEQLTTLGPESRERVMEDIA